MTAYLQTWTEGARLAREREGMPLDYAASAQFGRVGLAEGDTLYVGYLEDKRLHLLGRMRVEEVVEQAEAVTRADRELWEASYYAIADVPRSTTIIFGRAVPLSDVRALRFVTATGTESALDVGSDGEINGQSLQSVRRLTPDSARRLERALDAANGRARKRLTKAEQIAVERRAMDVVRAHYEARSWSVTDVHSNHPYDFACRKGRQMHHVEVKGLTGRPVRVELTQNEVLHADECTATPVLCVVHSITLRREVPEALGGSLIEYVPWRPADDDLTPRSYYYDLPR